MSAGSHHRELSEQIPANKLHTLHTTKLADLLSCWDGFSVADRFHLRDEQRRITFWIAPDRRIVLLTTFRKQRQNERREVGRVHDVLKRAQQELDG